MRAGSTDTEGPSEPVDQVASIAAPNGPEAPDGPSPFKFKFPFYFSVLNCKCTGCYVVITNPGLGYSLI